MLVKVAPFLKSYSDAVLPLSIVRDILGPLQKFLTMDNGEAAFEKLSKKGGLHEEPPCKHWSLQNALILVSFQWECCLS